jgi:UDP-N-acetyl-D-glucosamine/UDP-N-acetyl-D-galactosamine dehydrogenase
MMQKKFSKMQKDKNIISVIGLGYVGLPLAIELGKFFNVVGFDISKERIISLKKNYDLSGEVKPEEFKKSKFLSFSYKKKDINNVKVFIISVPTPIKKNNQPDISFIMKACDIIANSIQKKSIIVLESTVYPGFCEEVLAPYIQKLTGYEFNKDFFIGYSPERINPGDSEYKLKNIVKIVSASNKSTLDYLYYIYNSIITAGIHKAKSIKVAESAKVIENIQRDINVAFVNELSIIFNKMNINTSEVLEAARTKWNFLNFSPGLVGGHCIGIDPYYLTYKCKQIGFDPKLILAGRKMNDYLPKFISNKIIKKFKNKKNVKGLILGASFKENCGDVRNSGSKKIFDHLVKKKFKIDIYDPIAIVEECKKIYKKAYINKLKKNSYDFIIVAVSHNFFKRMGFKKINELFKKDSYLLDIKGIFKKSQSQFRL